MVKIQKGEETIENISRPCSRSREGFTLIELLVVISIISVLSTIAMTSLNGARAKARDARRYSDMNEIKNAIEMYAADHGGVYPSTGGVLVCLGIPSTEACWGTTATSTTPAHGSDALNVALAPYLPEIPKDPLYGKRIYSAYVYRSPGSYWLPSPVNTVSGPYAIAFEPDSISASSSAAGCGRWVWGAWDQSPGGVHCPTGGNCRQCGYLGGL